MCFLVISPKNKWADVLVGQVQADVEPVMLSCMIVFPGDLL